MENLSLGFGGRTLFSDLNLRIGEEDRIGVVGRNGSGKSSLLKIIAGQQEPENGSIRLSGNIRIGYLPQELGAVSGRGLLDFVLESVPGKADLERSLERVQADLEAADEEAEQLALSEKLVELHEDLAQFETAYSKHEAHRILAGLGFKEADMDRDVGEFSGGWRMRAVLSGLLFQRPDLLLLDEPTNHLDIPSVAWLADFLRRHRLAFMLICHDREFLNEQVGRIVSFETEGVRQYGGDYEAYLAARAEELTVLERRASNIAREREQAERFIRRFRAQATKARAVQSKIKAIEKLDQIVLPEEQSSLSFRFPPCTRTGQDVVVLEGVAHDYGKGNVFSGIEATARRGDRIAIVGANGNGKTTLLKIIAGIMEPTAGRARLGHNVEVGYYAQHVTEQLNLNASIFDEVWRESVLNDVSRVRTALGTMLFSGDDVDKRIGVLSGGEKARVSLARLMVNPGNLIVMDEPTNHLDLESSEALADALAGFDGTLLFASHNRSFVNHLATRIWDVSDGKVLEFPGTLAEYIAHCNEDSRAKEALETETEQAGLSNAAQPSAGKAKAKSGGAKRPKKKRGSQSLERKIAEYESRIAELEQAQSDRSAELSRPEIYDDRARYDSLLGEFQRDAAKLEELIGRWEAAQSELAGAD
jgi:ATP-binding cassette subfamily F protein 3